MGQDCLNRMLINPIFLENTAFTKEAHKLLVHGVYDWKKPVKEETFDEVKWFCKEKFECLYRVCKSLGLSAVYSNFN